MKGILTNMVAMLDKDQATARQIGARIVHGLAREHAKLHGKDDYIVEIEQEPLQYTDIDAQRWALSHARIISHLSLALIAYTTYYSDPLLYTLVQHQLTDVYKILRTE